jgi:hypothetical protein
MVPPSPSDALSRVNVIIIIMSDAPREGTHLWWRTRRSRLHPAPLAVQHRSRTKGYSPGRTRKNNARHCP